MMFASQKLWAMLAVALFLQKVSSSEDFEVNPVVRMLEPPLDFTYKSSEAYIFPEVQGFEVGVDGPLCFQVMWDKGQQQFCANGVERFVLGGLESGGYAVVATLRHASEDGEVVAEDFRTFSVDVDSHEPRVKITYPEENGIITTSTVEVFFVVAYPQDDIVVCLSANDFTIGMSCFENNKHYWTIQVKEPGRVRVQAKLYYRNGTLVEGLQTHSSVNFEVQPADPTLTSSVKDLSSEIKASTMEELQSGSGLNLPQIVSTPLTEQVHMAVISARSNERYEEALVMMKSALFHWGKRTAHQYKSLHLHLIVDPGGRQFFKDNLLSQMLSRVQVSFYDFHSTCTEPVDRFLAKFELLISAHYSGRAGYCRLFLLDIFKDLDAVIAIESDQLFFEDPGMLWNQFFEFPEKAILAAPELYQPWRDSRPYASGKTPVSVPALDESTLDADDHGNGLIGGIMLFNLTRMRESNWEALWHESFGEFLKQQEKGWSPTLNDQDVFNAVLSVKPHLGTMLPCEWNLQYHAYMNSLRICGHESLNCKAALEQGIFVCPRHPNVVHFMAGTYRGPPQYYNTFWNVYRDLPFFLINEALQHDHRKTVHISA